VTTSELRRFVTQRAKERCEYCLLPQSTHFTTYQLDHIIAKKHGSSDDESNLALCCPDCNRHKGSNIDHHRKLCGVFNPCQHIWNQHFRTEAGVILGLTPQGQATVAIFHLNEPVRVTKTLQLIQLGLSA
jgi:hypothetical protein